MSFRFVGAYITNNSWIGYIFIVERHRRFQDEVSGVGSVNAVPNALVQSSKFVCQRLVPRYFIRARNNMVKFLNSTDGGVNDGIVLETESGRIGVSGADEFYLLMAAVTERVLGRVGRDVATTTGQHYLAEGRGSRDCVAGGVWLKEHLAAVVAVLRPHELVGRSRQGWGDGDQVELDVVVLQM